MENKVMEAEIVKAPPAQIEQTKLQDAQLKLAEEASIIAARKQEVLDKYKFIELGDKASYRAAGAIRTEIKAKYKVGGFLIDPLLSVVKQVGDFLRGERTTHENACDEVVELIDKSLKDYDNREETARKAEEDRINAENKLKADQAAAETKRRLDEQAEEDRKAHERNIASAVEAGELGKRQANELLKKVETQTQERKQEATTVAQKVAQNVKQVKVKADIPHVVGRRNVTYYYAEVSDPQPVLTAYETAIVNEDHDRADFLRQFITVDAQKVSEYARSTKNNEKVQQDIPGAKAWSES